LAKTKAAIAVLQKVGAFEDVEKARDSRKLRRGKGKMRNRRHVMRRGPLIVYNEDHGVVKAFRNLPGVELAQVERLNLLQLAPGGHLGRFIIWTQSAFEQLNNVFGSTRRPSTQKSGYKLPFNIMTNTDLTRLINSDEVQSKVLPPKAQTARARRKKNPLKNFGVKVRLNPYAMAYRRSELLARQRRAALKEANAEARRKNAPVQRSLQEAQKLARAKTHAPNKSANFQKITVEDFQFPRPAAAKVYEPQTTVGAKLSLKAEKKQAPAKEKKTAKGKGKKGGKK
jgi:large subunit ribosomal protein L4e